MALGLGLLCWIALLFSPLAFVQTVNADDADSYGTVIGIVSKWHGLRPAATLLTRIAT